MIGAVFTPGASRWHCLTVPPQREAAAEAWLARHGVHAFHPVRVRYKQDKGKQRRLVSRYLPGYVFARFPGPVVWHTLQASPLITDAVRMSDGLTLACLNSNDLRLLQAMADEDETQRQRKEMAARIRPGDRVRIVEGVMEGHEVEVLRLKAGKATFSIRMFGADAIDAEAPVERLLKLG